MRSYVTPEEHARIHRRRRRQALGLVMAVLLVIGILTVLGAGVRLVTSLFDNTEQMQEYEDKLEGLVLFDPLPFEGIENIDDLTLREAAVWGCIYNIQETQGNFDNYAHDPVTEQLLLPAVGIPVSQVLSVCLAVGAAAAILIRRKKMRKNTVTQDIVEEKKK